MRLFFPALLLLLLQGPPPASAQLFNALVSSRAVESPFTGSPLPFFTQTAAIQYDNGGQGIGYNVPNPGCFASSCVSGATAYRPDAVNFKTSTFVGVPYQLGFNGSPDSYCYTISISQAGPYIVTLWLADSSTGGAWNVEIDGNSVATVITPNTGSFTTFAASASPSFNATIGTHIMCLAWESGDALFAVAGDLVAWQGSQASGSITDPTVGLLPTDRSAWANWKMAGLLSKGGIPNRTTQCGATITPLGGGADDTSKIQTAINACPAGQVVNLAAGTFTIAEPSHLHVGSGITVRGAGPQKTILTRPTGSPPPGNTETCPPSAGEGATWNCPNGGASSTEMFDVGFDRFVGNNETACALTADAIAGSSTVNVTPSCASLFQVGDIVLLDELTGSQWMPDAEYAAGIWGESDYRVVYHVHNPSQGGDDGLIGVQQNYTLNCDRMTNELKQVAAVSTSNNTVTFDDPVMISYRVGPGTTQAACGSTASPGSAHAATLWHFATPFVQQAGIEGLTMQYADNGSVFLSYCAYCWIKRVEVEYYIGQGVHLNAAFRPEVNQLYIHECVWAVPGEGCYNIDQKYDTSEALIWNSISTLADKVMTARASGAGSVVAYNYVDKGYIRDTCCWQEIGLNGSHLTGAHHMLFEGNWTFNMDSDATHGGSDYMTYFRNQSTAVRTTFLGMDATGTENDAANNCNGGAPMRAAGMQAYSYWFSFIGNFLGTPGCTTQANAFPLNGSWNGPHGSSGIHLYGWWPDGNSINDPMGSTIYPTSPPTVACGAGGGACTVPTASCATFGSNCATIDDSNWDTWHNAQTNAHALPNSFFLTSAPSFFGANTWPWVNPSAGTTATLPAKAAYDGANCGTATFQNNAQCTPFP